MTDIDRERDLYERYDRGDPTVGKTKCPRCGGEGLMVGRDAAHARPYNGPRDDDAGLSPWWCGCDDGEILVEKPATSRL